MIVARDIREQIEPFLKRKEFIAIVGPRQAGKTTFLEIIREYLIKEEKIKKELISFVTFEDRRLLKQFEDDPLSFIYSFIPPDTNETFYLLLDEFQYAEEGGQRLKLIYDTLKNVKIIITGSSSLEIKAQVGKYLVGRILTFHLYPFNFAELLRFKNTRLERIYLEKQKIITGFLSEEGIKDFKTGEDAFFSEMTGYFEEYCTWGGYPAVVLSKTEKEKQKILGDIFNNYMLKDIKGLLALATEKKLFLLSQYLATHIGNIMVYQTIGQVAGLDYRNLKKHLNILKETFIFDEVKPYFENRQKELSKNPKIYFKDIGFRNYLVENTVGLDKRPDSGAIVENMVFIRLDELVGSMGRLNFWRTKAGAEVDFVLRIKGEIVPIEVKYSKYDGPKISRSFMSFVESFKPKKGLVMTKNFWGNFKRGDTEILFAPVYYL